MLDKVKAAPAAAEPKFSFSDLEAPICDLPRLAHLLNSACMGKSQADREATMFLVDLLKAKTDELQRQYYVAHDNWNREG